MAGNVNPDDVREVGCALSRVKGRLDPDQPMFIQTHHVKSARWGRSESPQVVTCGPDDACALGGCDTRQRPAIALAAAQPHFHKHQGAIRGPHDEIDFSAPSARRPIMGLEQTQPLRLQVARGAAFGRITQGLGGAGCVSVRVLERIE